MLTAYLDESGHESKSWMFVAGFLGNQDQWKELVPLWREALGPQRKKLHMSDLRWNKQSTKHLLARLGSVPYKCKLQPVLAGVRTCDYEDLVKGTPAEKLLKGYLASIIPMVIQILRAIPSNERLELVFEQQSEYEPYVHSALASLTDLHFYRQEWFKTDHGLPKLAKWSFVPKNSTPLTEPADYFVFALRHLYPTISFIRYVVRDLQPGYPEIVKFGHDTEEALFLFDEQIAQYLGELSSRAVRLHAVYENEGGCGDKGCWEVL